MKKKDKDIEYSEAHSGLTPLFSLSLIGGTLAITGTYLLVTFAPHTSTHITAHLVQYYAVSWHFLLYLVCKPLLPESSNILCASMFLLPWSYCWHG